MYFSAGLEHRPKREDISHKLAIRALVEFMGLGLPFSVHGISQ